MKTKIYSKIREILFILLISPVLAVTGSNLPNTPASSVITGKDHNKLKTYFQGYEYLPNPISDTIGNILLKQLPKIYQNGCKEMISKWGKSVKGTEAIAVKPIHFVNFSGETYHLILVYTCYSTAENYQDRYYDERLAVLTIDSARSSITMIPHGKDCDTCVEMSHIGLYEDTLKIGGIDAVSIIIGTTNENPCCERSVSTEDVTIKYLAIDRNQIRDILSVNILRKETYHNRQDGDSVFRRTTSVETGGDKDRNINTLILISDVKINDSTIRKEVKKYIWNRKRMAFEEGLH